MKAKDFEFDSKMLSSFGFVIVNFGGSKGLEIVEGAEITFNMISSFNGSIHHLVSSEYENCLKTSIQIAKYSCFTGIQEISPIELRKISSWLNRKKFLKFKLLDEGHIDMYYMASVANISRIELDGRLVGLELNIVTNSPHAFKEPRTTVIQATYLYAWDKFYLIDDDQKGENTGEYVTSYKRDLYPDDGVYNKYYYVYADEKKRFNNKYSINDSSYEEGHIYPYTQITVEEDGDLDIYNAIEDRHTIIKNCKVNEVITMDYPVITSSLSTHDIQNDFNYNFFRIANTYDNSRNDLTISLPCSIKVEYSPIVKVGL